MSISVAGKLNKAANEFQAGESKGFGLRVGEQYYDRETKQKEWTNYECVVFAKASGQIDFYRDALVAGAVVHIMGKTAKIKSFDGSSGQSLSIELLDASIGYIGTVGSESAALAQQARAAAQQDRPVQQAPRQPDNSQYPDDFDDTEIPF